MRQFSLDFVLSSVVLFSLAPRRDASACFHSGTCADRYVEDCSCAPVCVLSLFCLRDAFQPLRERYFAMNSSSAEE
jgi:hypothetical protein